jgi:hypothetical protein
MAVIGAELNATQLGGLCWLHDIQRLQKAILYIAVMIMEYLGLRSRILMVVKMYG